MPETVATRYALTRFVILRLLGLVYFFAFLSLARQVLPLIGHDGLLPAATYLQRVESYSGSRLEGFLRLPSLFLIDLSHATLQRLAPAAAVLSLLLLLGLAHRHLPPLPS